MKHKTWFNLLALFGLVLALAGGAGAQGPTTQGGPGAQAVLGTAFTYQGRLTDGGSPANGTYDLQFTLYDAASGGAAVGSTVTAADVDVADGLFTVRLDFGVNAFRGQARYLAVAVRPGDSSGAYTPLSPRQPLTAAPYALYAMGAPWSGLSGVPAGFADEVDDDTTYTAGAGLVLNGTQFQAAGVPYANVVVVAKSGGNYGSVQAAIDSIADASAANPYLVWVAPGVYNETVTMKPYVHLRGAGQEATVITSTASSAWGDWPPQATLALASHASLRDLTVGNGGTGGYSVALLAGTGTAGALVADVTARAQGSSDENYAALLTGSGTSVTLQAVIALGENGSDWNCGLSTRDGAAATLRGGSFTGRGGDRAYGIHNGGSGTTLEAQGITALAENGNLLAHGLDNWGATVEITRSVLEGATNAVYRSSGTVTVSHSRLVGGAVGGTVTCVAVSRGTTFNASGCP
jgi:hypothetical protein